MALIGANGAGKTSILRAITGLRKIRSGEIRFRRPAYRRRSRRTQSSRWASPWCLRAAASFPLMSVKDNLLMGAFTRPDKAEVARTLEAVLARFPRLQGALRPGGGHHERRRAADAGDRPRADEPTRRCCCSTSPRSASRRSWCRTSPARSSPSIATRRSACCWSSRIRAWRSGSRHGLMRLAPAPSRCPGVRPSFSMMSASRRSISAENCEVRSERNAHSCHQSQHHRVDDAKNRRRGAGSGRPRHHDRSGQPGVRPAEHRGLL